MSYRIVDHYYRQAQLDFFRQYSSPFYSLTFELEVGPLLLFLERRGLPVYLNLCYVLVKAMNGIEDFRYRLLQGQLVLFDELHLGLTVPAPDGLFSFAYYEYDADFEHFNELAAEDVARGRQAVTLEERAEPNYVFLTAIPRVSFTSFSHVALPDPTAGQPQVAFGKFFERDDRQWVPVGLTVNHLFIDGGALGRLVETAQALFRHPAGLRGGGEPGPTV